MPFKVARVSNLAERVFNLQSMAFVYCIVSFVAIARFCVRPANRKGGKLRCKVARMIS